MLQKKININLCGAGSLCLCPICDFIVLVRQFWDGEKKKKAKRGELYDLVNPLIMPE